MGFVGVRKCYVLLREWVLPCYAFNLHHLRRFIIVIGGAASSAWRKLYLTLWPLPSAFSPFAGTSILCRWRAQCCHGFVGSRVARVYFRRSLDSFLPRSYADRPY